MLHADRFFKKNKNIVYQIRFNLTLYGQVLNANEEDGDSTPGNGSCCTANEDDEAVLALGGGGGFSTSANFQMLQLLNIYPNPTPGDVVHLNLYSPASEAQLVQIYDNKGRLIQGRVFELTEGFNQISIQINELNSGVYSIQIPGKPLKNMNKIFIVQRL